MTDEGLQLDALTIGYGAPIIRGFDLVVPPATITAVLGPSGCGKSTLLKTIAGIQPVLGGHIVIDGRDVTGVAVHERRVGMVFQEPLLFPHLDVVDNVAYGLRRHGRSRADARRGATELLAWVGLAGLEDRSVATLSGGQAQRVALARAIAPEPRVMLLDEPFSALDVDLRHRLAREVSELLRERDCASVYVTHDPDEARAIADTVVTLG